MTEGIIHLRRQIRHLYEKIEILENREKKNLKLQAEIKELSDYLDQVRIFMLRLSQGHVPLNILVEHLGHKVEENELRKLYDGMLNKPRHLRRRALTIILYLYGFDDKPII